MQLNPPPNAEIKMSEAILPLPPHAFTACDRKNLHFTKQELYHITCTVQQNKKET
jgi:hypothetical protein